MSPLRPILRVALPVAVAAVFVCLAVVNVALVKTFPTEADDGVLWKRDFADVDAADVAAGSAGQHGGIRAGDVLFKIDDNIIDTEQDVIEALHKMEPGHVAHYLTKRSGIEQLLTFELQPLPIVRHGLYFSLAFVGILTIIVGGAVRLRRPNDPATLHFFWLTVAFFGALAFTPSGR